MTIGVTGHRDIPSEAHGYVCGALTAALYGVRRLLGRVEVLSGLAIGADQIFAEIALGCGARLIAVSPAADYQVTFTDGQLPRYQALLRPAHTRVVMDHRHVSDEAYYAAGAYIADHCDLMLAVLPVLRPDHR